MTELKTVTEQVLAAKLEQLRALHPSEPSGQTRPAAGTSLSQYRERKSKEQQIAELERAGIYERYRDVTFASIEARGLPENQSLRANYACVKDYAAHIEKNVKDGNGLILAGNYGTMKTTMVVAVLRAWLKAGKGGLLVPMCSLIDNLYTMKVLNREEWANYERRIRRVPLLVIDDLGGENTDQGWVLAKIDAIITERYNRKRPVLITTNYTKKELAGTYSGRVMDRLKEACWYLAFDGESERRPLN